MLKRTLLFQVLTANNMFATNKIIIINKIGGVKGSS